jgi:peptide/nickel transport system permease protein
MVGVFSVVLAMAVGVPLGLISGYAGGIVDGVLMRVTDGLLAIPSLILAIALAAFLGASLTNAMIAIGAAAAPIFIRLTRGQVLVVRGEQYVDAVRTMGFSGLRIIGRHILPNILAVLLVQATIQLALDIHPEGPFLPRARSATADPAGALPWMRRAASSSSAPGCPSGRASSSASRYSG